jgi:hypothetical protein
MSLFLAALGGGARAYTEIQKEDRDWMKNYYKETDAWLKGDGLAALQRNKKDAGAYKQMATRMIQKGIATPGSIMHILNHGKLDGLASVYATVSDRTDITPEAFNNSINYAIQEDTSDSNLNFTGAIDKFFGLYRGEPNNPVKDQENSRMASLFGIKSPFVREKRYDVDELLSKPFVGSGPYTGSDIRRIASTDPTLVASYADTQTSDAFTFNPSRFPIKYSLNQKIDNENAFRRRIKSLVKQVNETSGGSVGQDDQGFSAFVEWGEELKKAYKANDIQAMYEAENKREAWFAEYRPGVPFTNSFRILVENEIANPGIITDNENASLLNLIYRDERAKYDAELLDQYNKAKENDENIPPFNKIGVFATVKQQETYYPNRTYPHPYAFIGGKLRKTSR